MISDYQRGYSAALAGRDEDSSRPAAWREGWKRGRIRHLEERIESLAESLHSCAEDDVGRDVNDNTVALYRMVARKLREIL